MKNIYLKYRTGFTLIELLTVVAIISLMTAVILPNLTSSRAKSRDTKRISDLGQIQLALAVYFDRCRQYPSEIADVAANNGCPTGISLGTYISAIPTPTPGGSATQTTYDYVVPGDYSDFMLHATLESSNGVLKDGFHGSLPFTPTASPTWTCPAYGGTDVDYCLGSK